MIEVNIEAIVLISLLIFGGIGIGICFIDEVYKHPQAAENANQICQEQGYDFYEKFSRVGILSTKPVAIKCQYVSSYSEQDLNIKGNIPVTLTE